MSPGRVITGESGTGRGGGRGRRRRRRKREGRWRGGEKKRVKQTQPRLNIYKNNGSVSLVSRPRGAGR